MAGGVIHAAWVQAAPVWLAAGAAIYGLSTWRRQLRGQRQLEHAEKALAAGPEAFGAIRAMRNRLSSIPPEQADDRAKRRAALLSLMNNRLATAWAAWRRLNEHYALAGLYAGPDPSRPNVSRVVADCLYDLQDHAEVFFTDWGDNDNPAYRQEIAEARKGFYGVTTPLGGSDPIEERLQAAEAALEAELRPILNPQSGWAGARAYWNRNVRMPGGHSSTGTKTG